VADLHDIVKAHEEWRLREALNLQASENVMSDAARSLLSTDFAHRYTLPDDLVPSLAGLKNAYRGTKHTDAVEELAERHAREVFRSAFASLKPLSGHLAGFLLLQACCKRGDRILVISAAHGGYDGYMPGFLPEYLGLDVQFLPFDPRVWNVDPKAAADLIIETRPRLVLLGASFILFPYNLRWLRGACDDVGTILGYDASHVLGLIAGGQFQDPLHEGADVLTGSTHKTLPGPQHGILLSDSDDEKFIKRLQRAVFPGVVSNHHLHAMAALGITLAEFVEFGREYAAQIVRNSKALAQALHERGIKVLAEKHGFTESHTVALDVAAIGGGAKLSADLEKANIITNKNLLPWDTSPVKPSGVRLGTQELTRLGMRESQMDEVADLFARVAVKHEPSEKVAADVGAMRTEFNTVHYCFTKDAEAHRRWRIA